MSKLFEPMTRWLARALPALIAMGCVSTDPNHNATAAPQQERPPEVMERIVIDKIWSAVPVGFCLLTHGDRQYVAYYNADRRMVVAMRSLAEDRFTRTVLPSE